ncbi:Ger(x)C family spore germination protein [Anaerosinus massiliensis]|uniref:Ger(x)C family spore germination protein n=1 Tax=Massilibacillus massiliensis TaxID=1806837 RepID=UPI000DA63749|nr:Ger(x)C family spore germination protein [Massilibacillus massiliensis]
MSRQKIIHIILLVILCLLLSGCWNRRELGNLSIVQGIGIDKTEDDQINITVQILKPGAMKSKTGEESNEKAIFTLSTTGRTMQEALRSATTESDRKLYLGQMKIIVIGEEAAKMGFAPLLDLFDRDQEDRRTRYIFIAHGKAKEVLEAEHPQEKLPAKAIESLAKATVATSQIAKITTHDVLKTLSNKTSAPFIPGIRVIEEKKDEKVKKKLRLEGTAVFNEDKLIGWLDKKETRGLLWILGQVKSGSLIVGSPGDETKPVGLEIIKASSNVEAKHINEKYVMHVKITEMGNISEQWTDLRLTTPEIFKEIEAKQAIVIREEIDAAIDKAQKELGADVFKFGEEIHREYPKEWKELKTRWPEEFQKLEIDVEIKAKLRNIGMTTRTEKTAE